MKKENEMRIEDINIGLFIEAIATRRGISNAQLAKMIHRDPSTVCDIYNRKNINTEQLWQISKALEYNFFTEVYGNNFDSEHHNGKDLDSITIFVPSDRITVKQRGRMITITESPKNQTK